MSTPKKTPNSPLLHFYRIINSTMRFYFICAVILSTIVLAYPGLIHIASIALLVGQLWNYVEASGGLGIASYHLSHGTRPSLQLFNAGICLLMGIITTYTFFNPSPLFLSLSLVSFGIAMWGLMLDNIWEGYEADKGSTTEITEAAAYFFAGLGAICLALCFLCGGNMALAFLITGATAHLVAAHMKLNLSFYDHDALTLLAYSPVDPALTIDPTPLSYQGRGAAPMPEADLTRSPSGD